MNVITLVFSSLSPSLENLKKLYSPVSLSNFLILIVLSLNTADPELLLEPSTPSLFRIVLSIVSELNNLMTLLFLSKVYISIGLLGLSFLEIKSSFLPLPSIS